MSELLLHHLLNKHPQLIVREYATFTTGIKTSAHLEVPPFRVERNQRYVGAVAFKGTRDRFQRKPYLKLFVCSARHSILSISRHLDSLRYRKPDANHVLALPCRSAHNDDFETLWVARDGH